MQKLAMNRDGLSLLYQALFAGYFAVIRVTGPTMASEEMILPFNWHVDTDRWSTMKSGIILTYSPMTPTGRVASGCAFIILPRAVPQLVLTEFVSLTDRHIYTILSTCGVTFELWLLSLSGVFHGRTNWRLTPR